MARSGESWARRYRSCGAVELAGLVRRGEVGAVDAARAALERQREVDGRLRAFTECWPERAVRMAGDVQRALARGDDLPLAGVPIGVKAGERAGAESTRRLIAAGCVPIGITAAPVQAAHPWQTWGHTPRGPTVNPWRADRVPGGSSAGSAAAVAAGIVPLATGSDGAGSIRIPAAWCAVVGLKLTAGRLPTTDPAGLTVPGPLTRTVADASAWVDVVLGRRPGGPGPSGVGAVWSADLGFAEPEREVVAVARAAAGRLEQAGVLAWRDRVVELHDPEPAWLALRGASTPGSGGRAADRLRRENDERLAAVFEQAELIVTPTTPNRPHPHSGPGETRSVGLTWAFNLSGHPAISVPAGFTADGCPVGLQLVGRPGAEVLLLRVAEALEAQAPWPAPPGHRPLPGRGEG